MIDTKELEIYLLGIKNNNENSFKFLYEKTKKIIFYNIFSYLKNYEYSEDVLQNTYINFLKNINKVNKEDILGYLLVISRNLSIDFIRKNKKIELVDMNEDYSLYINDEYKENSLLIRAKEILKNSEYSVLIRHIYSELTFKEIAHLDHKPLGTILWIYNNAIKKLKKEFKDYEKN